jgi:hypothetical protein
MFTLVLKLGIDVALTFPVPIDSLVKDFFTLTSTKRNWPASVFGMKILKSSLQLTERGRGREACVRKRLM